MGRLARLNPRSPDGWKPAGEVERARLRASPVSALASWLVQDGLKRIQAQLKTANAMLAGSRLLDQFGRPIYTDRDTAPPAEASHG
jgi:hypothetical protein